MKQIKTHKLFSVLCLLIISASINAQQQTKEQNYLLNKEIVGKINPRYTFTRVKNYKKEFGIDTLYSAELKGKWAILYLWTKSCAPCIRTFPKLDSVQKKYGSKIQILLVGVNDMYNNGIESYFDGVKNVQGLTLPVAYDSVWGNTLGIVYSGTAVIIDPSGKIEDVMLGTDLSYEKIDGFFRKSKSQM